MISPATQTLERAVRAYVAEGSGLESKRVAAGNRNAPAPNDPYATVLLITASGQGIPYTLYEDDEDEVDASTIGTVRARYSVQWYREGARDAARRFAMWSWSPRGVDVATARGLTFLRVSDVRQLDAIVSDAWEERAGLDLDLEYHEAIRQSAPVIGSAPIAIDRESFVVEGHSA